MPGKTGRTGNAVRFRSLKVIAGIVLMIVMTATTVMETRAEVNDSNIFDVTKAANETHNGVDYAIYTGTIRMKYSEAYIAAGRSLSSRYFIPCDGSQMANSSNTQNYDAFVEDTNDNVVVASSDILLPIVSADYGEALNSYTINGVSHKCCQVKFENHSGSDIQIPCGTYSLILHSDKLNTEIYKITLEVYDPDAGSSSNTDDSSSQAAVQSSSSEPSGCDHDFQWVCVKEPTAGEDGYDEYRCTKCGLVSQTRTTSGFSTFSDKTLDVVTSTPEGQPVSITTDSFWSFNHDFTDMIAARKSGDITVDFWYKNSHYKMTIPAGTDFTPYLTGTGKGYIGFMKIYSIVGGTCIGHR